MRRVIKLTIVVVCVAVAGLVVNRYLVPKPGIQLLDEKCNPLCARSIQPGKTTLQEAVSLVSQDAPLSLLELSVDGRQQSLNQINQVANDGRLFWKWPFGYYPNLADTNYATFSISTSIIPIITSVTVIAARPSVLKEYIDRFGQPTHILPYTITTGGISGEKPQTTLVAAYLIYREKGLILGLNPVPRSQSGDLIRDVTSVTSFTTFALSNEGIQSVIPNLGQTVLWKGMQEISIYCSQIKSLQGSC